MANMPEPRALNVKEIAAVIDEYRQATQYA
jgi:2,4-dienoyl-CoA reductase-like NADH-dependent reductase (Old Yellow Enzyme family)